MTAPTCPPDLGGGLESSSQREPHRNTREPSGSFPNLVCPGANHLSGGEDNDKAFTYQYHPCDWISAHAGNTPRAECAELRTLGGG